MSIPGFTLWQVSKLWQRTLTNTLKPFNIGSTEFVVLGNAVRFAQLDQPVTSAMLADATKIDRMTASQTLRSLENKGLIERTEVSEDQRTFHILPTAAGTKLADTALGEVILAHRAFFAPLGDNPAEFLKTIQSLIEANRNEKTT